MFHKPSGASVPAGALAALRRRNAAMLLDALRLRGPLARAELARLAGLDAKTVTNLVNILLRRRLVAAAGMTESSGGRPGERLALNADGAYAIGVDLGATSLRTVLVDLTGAVRAAHRRALGRSRGAEAILGQAAESIASIRRTAGVGSKELAGIGFASPGFIDRRRGVALEAVNIPGWKDVPVAAFLARRFRLPVFLEEASRSMALGEQWLGLGRQSGDLVCLDLGFGIGAGIIAGGRLHYGACESGGEIGHTTVLDGGPKCRCGKSGCLETVASGEAIARLSGQPSAKAAAAAAQAGDRLARRVILQAGGYLGVAAANLVNLLNPSLVILNGGLCNLGPILLEPFMQSLRSHALQRSLAATTVEQSHLGDSAGALGAATLALRPYFTHEL